ncbi:hypothetical protein DXG01_010975 [Tephrocybe rancida]|nr:hypothetical protein DXG01_010975 [Tephrocybe rancida]
MFAHALGLVFLGMVSAARLPVLRPLGVHHVTTIDKRSDTKYVFMHHIRGSSYPYTQDDWVADIKAISARGVDALALNYGGDSWQLDQIASAYGAVAAISSPLKLFLSPDFTIHSCDIATTIKEVKRFAGHPSQFKVDGKVLVSSFEGACLGADGWERLRTETGAWLMPFISGLEGRFGEWGSLDTWFCWGCAWPSGDNVKTTADDRYYMSQLGTRFGTTVSPWIYTHYDYKNFLQKSDDWLLLSRWEQLIELRDKLTFVEMVSCMGPIRGSEPSGTTWTNGFPHTAWYDLSSYYIHAFKTGSYPTITEDAVYYWARPHPASAKAKDDPLGSPQGWNWVSDTLWAAAFLTSPASVTLTIGSSSKTFDVPKGVTRLSIPLSPGTISVSVARAGKMVFSGKSDGADNFNAYVGVATLNGSCVTEGGIQPPSTPTSTTSSSSVGHSTISTIATSATISYTTTMTSKTTVTATPAPTPAIAPAGWTSLGCFPDSSNRLLPSFNKSSLSMTPKTCTSLCASKGYILAATEFGTECFGVKFSLMYYCAKKERFRNRILFIVAADFPQVPYPSTTRYGALNTPRPNTKNKMSTTNHLPPSFPAEVFALILQQLFYSEPKFIRPYLFENITLSNACTNFERRRLSRGSSFHSLLAENPTIGYYVRTLQLQTCMVYCRGDHEWALTTSLSLPFLRTLRLTAISALCPGMIHSIENILGLASLEEVSFWSAHMFPVHLLGLCVGIRRLELYGVPFGTRLEEKVEMWHHDHGSPHCLSQSAASRGGSSELTSLESLTLPIAEVNAPHLVAHWPTPLITRLTKFVTSASGSKALPYIQDILDFSAVSLQELHITLPNIAMGTGRHSCFLGEP